MKKLIIILLLTATASASIFINSFNSGRLGKKMKVRHDLDRTSMGSEVLDNILIRPQGMAYKRPGTEFIADTNDEDWVAEVPAIPPAPFRDEATVMANEAIVVWLDPNYAVLAYEDLNPFGTCTTVDVSSDGVVVAGVGQSGVDPSYILQWDTDLNLTTDFYTPDGGWIRNNLVGALRFTNSGDYLYALTGSTNIRLYKFDTSDGSMEWVYNDGSVRPFSMYVDANDYVYLNDFTGAPQGGQVLTIDPNGNVANTAIIENLVRDTWIDETNSRAYIVGESLYSDFPNTTCLAAVNLDGTNKRYFSLGDSKQMFGVIKHGDYVYAVGERTSNGFGGATASVYKFDTDLNIVASYDTGLSSVYIWIDWDGNITVRSGYWSTGETNAGVWLLDDDLNYIADYRVESEALYGPEAHIIPFMDSGTPAVPGYWNKYGSRIDRNAVVRLIPFEYSVDDAYVLEFGHQYIGLLRTTR